MPSELKLTPNPATGKLRLTWESGDVAFDDARAETVVSLLVESEGPFTTNRRPGPGPLSVGLDTIDARSSIKARAEERLKVAIADGRLRGASVDVVRTERGALALAVSYETRDGRRDSLTIPMGAA